MAGSSVIARPSPIHDLDWLQWGGESDIDTSDTDADASPKAP
eukprot:gene16919-47324_t